MTSILLVQPSILDRRAGAAQIALNLREALAELGHAVELYTPSAGLPGAPWWDLERQLRRLLAENLATRPAFDIVDAPAWLVPRGANRVVARSVQPEIEYLRLERSRERSAGVPLVRRLAHRWHSAIVARAVLRGWQHADRILCLGSGELRRMRERYADLAPKLRSYRVAPSAEDRRRFREAAGRRRPAVSLSEARFLWIGRWSAHKGLDEVQEFVTGFLRAHPTSRLTVAGTGTAELRVRGLDLGAEPRVAVVPTFERDELPALLADHDAGLFTSSVEGWGLVLQEMLESGMPVYAKAAGAVDELSSWFPDHLLPYPPEPTGRLPQRISFGQLSAYDEEYDWRRLAADYLEAAR